jgi:hypothetical protein
MIMAFPLTKKSKEEKQTRYVQGVGVGAALVSFSLLVYYGFRKMIASDKTLK